MIFSRKASGLANVHDINWSPKWIRLWHHPLERLCQPPPSSLSQKSRRYQLVQKRLRSSKRRYQELIRTATEIDGVATEVEAVNEHRLADPEVGVGIALGEIVGTEIGTPTDETAETVMIDADATIAEIVVAAIVVRALAIGEEATAHAAEVVVNVGREIGEFEPTVLESAERKPKLSSWKASEPGSKNLGNGPRQERKLKTKVSQCHFSTNGRLNGIGRWRRRAVLLFLLHLEAEEMTTEMLLPPDHENPETEIETVIERGLHDLEEADRALLQ
jgi:hypothetical protein